MGSNFEVLQLIWAILSLPKSIDRGVLYTRQVAGISWSKYRYTSRYFTNQDQSSQESVLCTKCSISYIISRWPVNRVYWETSWFSAIYAGKIAFFTFGHFVGSNFEKPRTRQESVLCTKCSISYIISHRPVRGVYCETFSFSAIYAGKTAFFTFGNFVGSNFEKPRTSQESVLCTKCCILFINFKKMKKGFPINRLNFVQICRQ